ncbi:torsin-1A-interacting protein 2 [Aplysia californica]|uniref:Torsin-1A-interacting protein 2 n=1 Tax=Aplysia californica TaxID=6500 RepID=A0ABM1A6Z1_APLCA|nr:torsin-1A-interacting protein 2 [Aplysia californica]
MASGSPRTRRQQKQRESERRGSDHVVDSDEEDNLTSDDSDSDDSRSTFPGSRHTKSATQSSPEFSDLSSTSPLHRKSLDRSSPRGERSTCSSKSPKNINSSSSSARHTESEAPSSGTAVWVLMAILGFLCLFICCLSGRSETEVFDEGLMPFEKFLKDIESLEKAFPAQGRRTWKTVKATAKHVLNETDPIYPSIILMGVETGNSKLASCIASEIASRFESSLGQSPAGRKTDIGTYKHLSPAEQKMKLDEAFLGAFHNSGSKSLLVENLQLLSGEAALLLHGYCDNDNAPYKNVFILLMVNISPGEMVLDVGRPSNVEAYLADIWGKGIDVDKVNALMSRVANNVVVVTREGEDVFKNKCMI